jgi:hypothetical protein
VSGQAERDFGPLGTIGLEFFATSDFCLPTENNPVAPHVDERQPPQAFLWQGRCAARTGFRLRIAHPEKWFTDDKGEELYDFVQLTVNETYTLEFKRRVYYGDLASSTAPGEGRRDDPYAFRCSKEFIPGEMSNAGDCFAEIKLDRDSIQVVTSRGNAQIAPSLCELAVKRICDLVELLLSGYFHIGAVRTPHDYENINDVIPNTGTRDLIDEIKNEVSRDLIDEIKEKISENPKRNQIIVKLDKVKWAIPRTPTRAELIGQRYVGYKGEGPIALLQEYAYNLMRDPRPPHTGHIDQCFPKNERSKWWRVGQHLKKSSEDQKPSALRRIWELADPEIRRQLMEHEQHAATGEYDESLLLSWGDLLNTVLTRRELYQPDLWPDLDEESRYLIERGMDRLSADEIERLNRLLIEAALPFASVPHCTGFLFETFVSEWLDRLVQVQVGEMDERNAAISLSDDWDKKSPPPAGFLVHDRRNWMPVGPDWDPEGHMREPHYDKTDRFLHPCIGNVSPSRKLASKATFLSSGFHQIAPLVVQAGLMKRFEIMAVENPEVHLHPSLQLEIAGFLMTQARSGKTIIIETHSDLIIRRVQRAVLEEEISQAEIEICFVALEKKAKLPWSQLTPLKVDDRGRISNWPPGFMDDDVKESRRLIETMYDAPSDEEPEP